MSADLRPDEDEGRDWVDRFVLVFVRESTLWPILIVIVAHIVAFLAPVLLLAVRDHHIPAACASLGIAWLSVQGVRFDRRRSAGFGALSGLFAVTWVMAIAGAVVANQTGIF